VMCELGENVATLNRWATPGKYWFVMTPKPAYLCNPHVLYMSNAKTFEGASHEECIRQAAEYLRTVESLSA